jgi:hypothetical protein
MYVVINYNVNGANMDKMIQVVTDLLMNNEELGDAATRYACEKLGIDYDDRQAALEDEKLEDRFYALHSNYVRMVLSGVSYRLEIVK